MMFDSLKFSTTDVAKLIGFLSVIGVMWYDLKTDFEVHKAEHRLLEYRLSELEKANRMTAALTYENCAIIPSKIELKDE